MLHVITDITLQYFFGIYMYQLSMSLTDVYLISCSNVNIVILEYKVSVIPEHFDCYLPVSYDGYCFRYLVFHLNFSICFDSVL